MNIKNVIQKRLNRKTVGTNSKGCIIVGNINAYARINVAGASYPIHRLITFDYDLEAAKTSKLMALHKCNVKGCCNKNHLYKGNESDNAYDAIDNKKHGGYHEKIRSHCPKGHTYNATNTYRRSFGKRLCRACRNLKMRESRLK